MVKRKLPGQTPGPKSERRERLFCFHLKAEPTLAAQATQDVGGAFVNVWVVAETMAEAEAKARAHLMDYAWVVTEVQIALEPTDEQIARLDEIETASYRKALRQGVSAVFDAWPKQARPGQSVEIRSLGPPVIDDKEH